MKTSPNPSNKPILVVQDCFQLTRPGLLLFPALSPEAAGTREQGHQTRVRLVRPDRSQDVVEAVFYWEHAQPGGFRYVCVLPATRQEQVPPGTEVWLST